jgi:hypothetical protein
MYYLEPVLYISRQKSHLETGKSYVGLSVFPWLLGTARPCVFLSCFEIMNDASKLCYEFFISNVHLSVHVMRVTSSGNAFVKNVSTIVVVPFVYTNCSFNFDNHNPMLIVFLLIASILNSTPHLRPDQSALRLPYASIS